MNKIKKADSVEVFSDMTFYIVDSINGKIQWKTLYTSALYAVVDALQQLHDNMHTDATLIACCYKEYEGSFNVVVDPVKQYEKIYNYGINKYKTFISKVSEKNIPETLELLSRGDLLRRKLNEMDGKLVDLNNKLNGETSKYMVDFYNKEIIKILGERETIIEQLLEHKEINLC